MGNPRPEATWVQPIPDALLASDDGDPAVVTVARETVRLAFIAALQHLAPRQRALLIERMGLLHQHQPQAAHHDQRGSAQPADSHQPEPAR